MITYFVQSPGLYVAFGLSTDTKPPTPPDNCLFIETDTALIFFSLASVWTLVTTGTNFVLTDVTTNDVNTSRHGFAPKSSGVATEFLNGLGGYSVPAGGGGISDGDKGDITVSGSGATWTIDADVVTNAKSANMATKTYKGRTSGGTGDPEDVAVATLKTDLVLVKGDVGLGNVDNTSDANKPVSSAQQTALDAKLDDSQATAFGLSLLDDVDAAAGRATLVISDATLSTTDITTNNVSTAKHGFMSKLPGGTSNFYREDGTWQSPGAGSTNIKQTEINFGAMPVSEASFLITDADVAAGSQLIGGVAYEAPTDKDLDEMEMDTLDLKFAPGTGEFTLYARGLDGYVEGKFKVNYLIG